MGNDSETVAYEVATDLETGGRPILALAWFESLVVSLGAVGGIISPPRSLSLAPHSPLVVAPTTLDAFVWLLAFVLVAWLGWCVHLSRPRSVTALVWGVALVCMLVWRPLLYFAGAIWPGAIVLLLATSAMALLVPLVAAFSLAASWVCMPLLFWLGYEVLTVINIAIHA
jgi:tryptophan-rich sensory protein